MRIRIEELDTTVRRRVYYLDLDVEPGEEESVLSDPEGIEEHHWLGYSEEAHEEETVDGSQEIVDMRRVDG